jgi:hypothetical protein
MPVVPIHLDESCRSNAERWVAYQVQGWAVCLQDSSRGMAGACDLIESLVGGPPALVKDILVLISCGTELPNGEFIQHVRQSPRKLRSVERLNKRRFYKRR